MTDTKVPKPEEVQKEFEDFVKKRFGGGVQIFTSNMADINPEKEDEPQEIEPEKLSFNFNYTPKQITEYLDRFVIDQEDAKRALAIAVCDHYNNAKLAIDETQSYEYAKQNVLLLGPTGVGKTYLVRKLAELIDVPFVKADATRFSETGYVGANVDDLIRDLVNQADGDIARAECGIIYLDEADKLAQGQGAGGRDVNGRGVQFGLLRLMEDCEVDLKSGNDIQSQMQAFMEMQSGKKKPSRVRTRNILFVLSGAFSGIEEIIRKRLNKTPIGFNSTRSSQDYSEDEIMKQACTEDFLNFGYEAEFVGRLPIRVACRHLDAQNLESILRNSEGSLIKQYKSSFQAYGIDIRFNDRSITTLATKAAAEKTGARGLMTVCEQAIRQFKYELPGSDIKSFEVTEDVIQNPDLALKELLDSHQTKKELDPIFTEIFDKFELAFKHEHDVLIELAADLRYELARRSDFDTSKIDQILNETFSAYEHGLTLIKQSTGKSQFELCESIFPDPQKHLEKMILDNYSTES